MNRTGEMIMMKMMDFNSIFATIAFACWPDDVRRKSIQVTERFIQDDTKGENHFLFLPKTTVEEKMRG